jgi:hypothetical protein
MMKLRALVSAGPRLGYRGKGDNTPYQDAAKQTKISSCFSIIELLHKENSFHRKNLLIGYFYW